VNLIRLILFPVSFVYGVITWLRNILFDWRILPSKSFDIPIISVGNLSVGGTGKTPHIEYLIRLLGKENKVAVLSRGYKRDSKGFIIADENSTTVEIGDEPCQFNRKFKNIIVSVDEKRKRGITNLLKQATPPGIILMDDAFQHRSVKPGVSILLTDFHNMYTHDYMLPTGSLREFRVGAKRADIIVVTKTSKVLSPITRQSFQEEIKPKPHQKILYSYLDYGPLMRIKGIDFIPDGRKRYNTIMIVAGIANTYPLEFHLKNFCDEIKLLKFPDHHSYNQKDIVKIMEVFDGIITQNKIIVTTEKDLMRISRPDYLNTLQQYPVCYIQIEIIFHKEDKPVFDKYILDYVRSDNRDSSIHQKQD
jgi:tetraacyldisaccharide 4'-kinase